MTSAMLLAANGSVGEAWAFWLLAPLAVIGALLVKENLAGQLRSARVERSRAAVDVVDAGPAGGKPKVAQFEGLMGEEAKQFLTGGWHGEK